MINKKILIFSIIILALISILLIIHSSEKESPRIEKEQSKTEIKIGGVISPVNLHTFPLFVAKEKGFFNDYGLEVQFKELDLASVVPALLAKEIDYFAFTATGVRASFKAPLKTIMTFTNTSFFALIAQNGLELKNLKTIGISFWQGSLHYMALETIETNNLSAKIIAAGSHLGVIALLTSGQTDAILYTLPYALQLERESYSIIKIFDDDNMAQGLTTSNDKIENNPEEVKKVISAIQSAVGFIKNNPEEAKRLLFKFMDWKENESTQAMVTKLYAALSEGLNEGGMPPEECINKLIRMGKTGIFETIEEVEGQTVTQEDIATVFDFRFLK